MIPGVRVGHATDAVGLTGCTAVLSDAPAVGGVEIRGWAAGVHGLDFLDPRHLVPTMDGVVLSGGSAFGLESIWGVMQWLEEQGVGFRTRETVVPHVAGAILYDLAVGDRTARPDRAMGYRAAAAARPGPVPEGNVGAGTGATVGKLHGIAQATRGGIGCATAEAAGVAVGALVAVNAVGDVRDPATGRLIAGARDAPDGRRLVDSAARLAAGAPAPRFSPAHTTIGVVATTAGLDKPGAARLAQLGMAGFGRALSPPHLGTDGDTLFALSVGTAAADLDALGRLAADLVARAIVRAVRAAESLPGLPAARDL
jgi:L-aminopeptidase/D-esterase-like protein